MAVLKMTAGDSRRRAWPHRLTAGLLGLALMFLAAPAARAEATLSPEYQLKAVFLFNFAQFVEWPAQAFPDPKAPLVIGVLGKDPFGAYLDDLVSGEKIGDRPLVIRRYGGLEDVAGCHILFISRSEARNLEAIFTRLRQQCVLTVSDVDNFARQGGMVRFVMENGKIRLRINVEAAKAAKLSISSKVLRPDTIVTPSKD